MAILPFVLDLWELVNNITRLFPIYVCCDTDQSSSFSDRNGISSGPAHLRRECSEWTHQFPHFRIIGHQVSLPQEQGFMFHESELSGNVTPKNSPRILLTNSPVNSDLSKSNTDTTDLEKWYLCPVLVNLYHGIVEYHWSAAVSDWIRLTRTSPMKKWTCFPVKKRSSLPMGKSWKS